MTVENQTNKVREDGDGVKVDFDFSFEVFSAADLEVYKVVKATGVATLQTITTDYTVALNTASAGGTVTFVTAPSALQESFIKRVVDLTQETDIPNVGGLREEQIENALDRGTMVDQQLQEQIDRCPKLADTSELSSLEMPTPEAGKYLGWNDDEDALENKAAPTAVDYAGNISFGLDAGKSASPAQGDVYFATDTGKVYVCFSSSTWTWYNPTTMTTRGDIEYYGASGKARLGVGTSGHFLKTQGAGADPVWASAAETVASQAQMEAASDNTVMVTPLAVKWHPGVAKAWASFNGTGTPALIASHNVDASITDGGSGIYSFTVTADFSSANFCLVGGTGEVTSLPGAIGFYSFAAGGFSVLTDRNGTLTDFPFISFAAFGDQ